MVRNKPLISKYLSYLSVLAEVEDYHNEPPSRNKLVLNPLQMDIQLHLGSACPRKEQIEY